MCLVKVLAKGGFGVGQLLKHASKRWDGGCDIFEGLPTEVLCVHGAKQRTVVDYLVLSFLRAKYFVVGPEPHHKMAVCKLWHTQGQQPGGVWACCLCCEATCKNCIGCS